MSTPRTILFKTEEYITYIQMNKLLPFNRLIVLITAMLIQSIAVPVLALAEELTWQGEGTKESPFEISDKAHLTAITEKGLSAYYMLTADIIIDEKNWTPIGTQEEPFEGTLDGQGYHINEVRYIKFDDLQYAGLFGFTGKEACIKNLGVKVKIAASATIAAYGGGIVAHNKGEIHNCYVEGEISAYTQHGDNTMCYNGGIAAINEGTIKDCYFYGNCITIACAGGIAGDNEKGTVTHCFANASISGINIGGIVSRGKASDCIFLSGNDFSSDNNNLGRISGDNTESYELSNNYANQDTYADWTNKGADKSDGADLTNANFIIAATPTDAGSAFEGWSTDSWDFSNPAYLPTLQTVGLSNGNKAINGQKVPIQLPRAEVIEHIDITGNTDYDPETHNQARIIVRQHATFTVASGSDAVFNSITVDAQGCLIMGASGNGGHTIKELVIKDEGKVIVKHPFTCEKLSFIRPTTPQWHAWGYNREMQVNPPSRKSLMLQHMTGYASAGQQQWGQAVTENVFSTATGVCSLLATEEEGEYVKMTTADKQPFVIPAGGTPPASAANYTGFYRFCANPVLRNMIVPVAYILNNSGTRFERKEKVEVKPFEAYMIAVEAPAANQSTPMISPAADNTQPAPPPPAIPYRISLVGKQGEKGKALLTDAGNSNGIIITHTDTLAYGAPSATDGQSNATTICIEIIPNEEVIMLQDLLKIYKTGDITTTVAFTKEDNKATFAMPLFPITVEVLYARRLEKIGAVTLKESKNTPDKILKILPRYVPIVLNGGLKDSLEVEAWSYETDNYNNAPGGVNEFTFTLSSPLSDRLVDYQNLLSDKLTGKAQVANMAQPLIPTEPNKGIIVSASVGENLTGQVGDSPSAPFNATIGQTGETAVISSLTIKNDVQDAILTLLNIEVTNNEQSEHSQTKVESDASLTLRLAGTNTLGQLTVNAGASLILQPEAGSMLRQTTVENNGCFTDSSATFPQIGGTGRLHILPQLSGGEGNVEQGSVLTLSAGTTDRAGITSFIWQQKQPDGSYTTVKTNAYNEQGLSTKAANAGITDPYQPATSTVGTNEYRCLIKREITGPGNSTPVVTLLSTLNKTVTVTTKSEPVAPDPPAVVYYELTLPSLPGARTTPTAGIYDVEAWSSFSFTLGLDTDYDQSKPVVSTSRNEIILPDSNGSYTIKYIRSNLSVAIDGIVKNLPTDNESVDAGSIRIWGDRGVLHISLPRATDIAIYSFDGALLKSGQQPAGTTLISLPAGSYVVTAGERNFKVIVR